MNLLVTGFGPFGEVSENPSAKLAEACGAEFEVIEVSFRAVDDFIAKRTKAPPELFLAIGVAARAEKMRFETVARNWIGPTPDARGEVWGPGPIDPAAPSMRAGNLWKPEWLAESELSCPSVDAGDYLCNYLYHQAIVHLPPSKVGFLHVPSFDRITFAIQAEIVGSLVQTLNAERSLL